MLGPLPRHRTLKAGNLLTLTRITGLTNHTDTTITSQDQAANTLNGIRIDTIIIIIVTITILTDRFAIPAKIPRRSSLWLLKHLRAKELRLEAGIPVTDINTSIVIIITVVIVGQRLFPAIRGMPWTLANRLNSPSLIRPEISLLLEDSIILLTEILHLKMVERIRVESSRLTGRSMEELVPRSLQKQGLTFISRSGVAIRGFTCRTGQAGSQCQRGTALLLAAGVNKVQNRRQIRIRIGIDSGTKVILFFKLGNSWSVDTMARQCV